LDDELLVDLYLGLGDVYRAQGNYELSIASYQQAIRAVRSAQDLTAGRDQQFDEGAFSLD
jgi:tetratricopeptide (TPR) repeat protein